MKSVFKSRPLPPIGKMDTDNQSPKKKGRVIKSFINDSDRIELSSKVSLPTTKAKYNLPTASSMMNTFAPMNSHGNMDYTIREFKERKELDSYTDVQEGMTQSFMDQVNADFNQSSEDIHKGEEKTVNLGNKKNQVGESPQISDSSNHPHDFKDHDIHRTKLSSVEELLEQQKLHEKQLKDLQIQIQLQRKITHSMERGRIKYPPPNTMTSKSTLRKDINDKTHGQTLSKPSSSPLQSEQNSFHHFSLHEQQKQLPSSAQSLNVSRNFSDGKGANGTSKNKIKFVPDVNFIKKRIEKKRMADMLSEKTPDGKVCIDPSNNNSRLPTISKVSGESSNTGPTNGKQPNKNERKSQLLANNTEINSKVMEASCFEDKRALIRKQYSDRRKLVEADLEKDLKLIKELESKLFKLQKSKENYSQAESSIVSNAPSSSIPYESNNKSDNSCLVNEDNEKEEGKEQLSNEELMEQNLKIEDMLKYAAQYPLASPTFRRDNESTEKLTKYFQTLPLSSANDKLKEDENPKVDTQSEDMKKDPSLSQDSFIDNKSSKIAKQPSSSLIPVTQAVNSPSICFKDIHQANFEKKDNCNIDQVKDNDNEKEFIGKKTEEENCKERDTFDRENVIEKEAEEKENKTSVTSSNDTPSIESAECTPNEKQKEQYTNVVEKKTESNKDFLTNKNQDDVRALSELSKENVSQVLINNSLSIYVEAFTKNGVDGEVLSDPTLTEDDLVELGVNIRLHRRRILSLLNSFKEKGVHSSQYILLDAKTNLSVDNPSSTSLVLSASSSPTKEIVKIKDSKEVKQFNKFEGEQPALDEDDVASDSSDSDDGEGQFSRYPPGQCKANEREISSSIFSALSPTKQRMRIKNGGKQNASPTFGNNFFFSPSKKKTNSSSGIS